MPSYKIKHQTRYAYAAPVIDCANQLMIYPLEDDRLEVLSHEVTVSNDPDIAFFEDYFGNKVGVFTVIKPHTELLVESELEVETTPILFPMDEETAGQQWQHLAELRDQAEFIDFLTPEPSPLRAEIEQVLQEVTNQADKPLKNALVLSEYVFDHFQYEQGVTSVETPTEEIWRLRAGVCQDFAHMLLYMLRLTGIPARYVSGYVCPKQEGVRGSGATHAWVEAYIPFYGWLGLDPTNNCIVNDGHVRMALGRHFSDCTPIKGTYKGTGAHTLTVSVHIENGEADKPHPPFEEPVYVQVREPEEPLVPVNSYRKYVTWEQQQQQQQQ